MFLNSRDVFSSGRFSRTNLTVFAITFAAIGGYIIYSSFAAGFSASIEAENSSKNSPAATVSDSGASGGSALKFQQPGNCPVSTPGELDGPDPWGGCWPGPLTTGVPAGTTLTTYTGPQTITAANTVIDSKRIAECLDIEAPGVIIKNSEISDGSNSDCTYVIHDSDGVGYPFPSNVTIQDSTIYCGTNPAIGGPGNAIGDSYITLKRVDISACENGGDLDQNIDIEDSYTHDLWHDASSHTDGFQLAHDHRVNNQAPDVNGALNITFNHNTIFGMHIGAVKGGPNADTEWETSAIIGGWFATNVNITKNLLAGGQYTIYCQSSSQGTGKYAGTSSVKDNHFSYWFGNGNFGRPTVGWFGASSDCADENKSGNVYHETGDPYALE